MEFDMSFAEILEAVDVLPLEQQIRFAETLKRRIIEKKREKLLDESRRSIYDFKQGNYIEETADSLINRLSGDTK